MNTVIKQNNSFAPWLHLTVLIDYHKRVCSTDLILRNDWDRKSSHIYSYCDCPCSVQRWGYTWSSASFCESRWMGQKLLQGGARPSCLVERSSQCWTGSILREDDSPGVGDKQTWCVIHLHTFWNKLFGIHAIFRARHPSRTLSLASAWGERFHDLRRGSGTHSAATWDLGRSGQGWLPTG